MKARKHESTKARKRESTKARKRERANGRTDERAKARKHEGSKAIPFFPSPLRPFAPSSLLPFFLSFLFFLSFSFTVLCQSTSPDAIIEKTSRIYTEWEGMDVKFTLHIYSEKNTLSESFEGAIRMKKNKFVLTTPDIKVWFDGTTQWAYNQRNEEVNINTPSGQDLRLTNPMLLLQDYKKDFNATYTGESTSANAKAAYDIALIPKKKDNIEKIDIQIEKNTSLPVKLVITMRNQLRNTIMISELKAGNPDDAIFSFPKTSYPDAEVIDLR